nr:Mut7-C RNAse domain-containing protein [Rhodothermus marinus]
MLDRFELHEFVDPFSRCMCCNAPLEPVEAEAVAAQIPPGIRTHYTEFYRCPACGRVYWEGSHHARMQRLIDQVMRGSGSSASH